jgi:small subunit ribosomal protein S6
VRSYECMIIFRPTVSDEDLKASTAKYAGVIAGRDGEITGLEGWGKRRLAYEIEDHLEGHYFLFRFRGTNPILAELARQLRIDETVIRHMIVVDELAKGNEPKIEPESLVPSARKEYEEVSRGETK